MFDPTGMILADNATRRHVTSGQPKAPRIPARQRNRPIRRLTVATLRRLADRLEPTPAEQRLCEAA